jgi:hypothetical protein
MPDLRVGSHSVIYLIFASNRRIFPLIKWRALPSYPGDPLVLKWKFEMLLQKMVADAHEAAKEIWDDMSEEELAVCFAHIYSC